MTFLYPLGLIGLVGVPIFIIVYLIKNRYTEQTIASTYLWRLSERFIRRRNPFSRLTGIISLILQLSLITVLSLAIARPIITLPGAAREYCFILDGSASMNIATDGKSRFDLAKSEIADLVRASKDGSSYTLLVVDEDSEVVYERLDSKEKALARLNKLQCSDSISDYTDAMSIAQGYFDENPSLITYLVTDSSYASAENVNVINVASNAYNASVDDVTYRLNADGTIIINGRVSSYGKAGTFDVEVYVDSSTAPIGSFRAVVGRDETVTFEISGECRQFKSLKAKINADDSYRKDNECIVYSEEKKNSYKTLIVSDTPFFLESAIRAASNAEISVMSTEDYISSTYSLVDQGKKMTGYDLYVFDAVNPIVMPEDGSVWLIGINDNVDDSGFSIQGEVVFADGAEKLSLTTKTSATVRKLTSGMIRDDVSIAKYVKCSLYSDFVTIYSYMGNPVIFTGVNTYGNREVVFSFNLHDSDFVLSADYIILSRNLLDFSFPNMVDSTEYYCGDTVEINVVSGCESIRIESPTGVATYADTSAAVSEFLFTEVGEYKINVKLTGSEREFYVYSSVPKEERKVESSYESIAIVGEASDKGSDGKLDPIAALFITAAVLFTAEWMVYCYDKYQLR